ncbi:MAG: ribulose-phosphate 3-epimerase, partial [Firmicutes bacterium]|nr:ribulose-phosphate 3-epimerase [Bacillota bacterium]
GQLEKISLIRREIDKRCRGTRLEVDGGITLDTARLCRESGADTIVAGSAIFKHAGGYSDSFRLLRGE